MPGAYNSNPMTFGAEKGSNLEILQESLIESHGTAFSEEHDSLVWADSFAYAKAIEYLWSTARRFANQWNPDKMTDFLPRFERIYGLRPLKSDTLVQRRAKVKAKMQLMGRPPTMQVINDLLDAVLGDIYHVVVHTDASEAVTQIPGGATIAGGATITDGPWYSTISYLAIKLVQPSYMDDKTFYDRAAQLPQFLDDILPAWVTYAWFKDGTESGSERPGFYLDEEKNLDNQRFD